MSLALEQLQAARALFAQKSDIQEVEKMTRKVTNMINNLATGNLPDAPPGTPGNGFNVLTGSDLSDYQMKLAGYKYYLADMIADLMNHSKYLEAYIKDYKAKSWNRVKDEIKEREGKVQNKEMIENELLLELSKDINEQIFYETEYQRLKLKSLAVDNILSAISQRLAELKRQMEVAKNA